MRSNNIHFVHLSDIPYDDIACYWIYQDILVRINISKESMLWSPSPGSCDRACSAPRIPLQRPGVVVREGWQCGLNLFIALTKREKLSTNCGVIMSSRSSNTMEGFCFHLISNKGWKIKTLWRKLEIGIIDIIIMDINNKTFMHIILIKSNAKYNMLEYGIIVNVVSDILLIFEQCIQFIP